MKIVRKYLWKIFILIVLFHSFKHNLLIYRVLVLEAITCHVKYYRK